MKVDRERQLVLLEEELMVSLLLVEGCRSRYLFYILNLSTVVLHHVLGTYVRSLFQDIDVDELRDSLPSHQPRFLVYSFKLDHKDGRISYPMCFIFSTPRGMFLSVSPMLVCPDGG